MKKVTAKFTGLLLILASISISVIPASANLKNVDNDPASVKLANYLLAQSTFSGIWWSGSNRGDIDIVFFESKDGLAGEITRGRGAVWRFDGPIQNVSIKKGVLRFNSSSGSLYELKLGEDKQAGWLVGSALFRQVIVELRPASK